MTPSQHLSGMCRRTAGILDQETRALTEGRFGDLSLTQGDRDKLIDQLLDQADDILEGSPNVSMLDHRELVAALETVRVAGMRNGAALTGALRGLKAGRARLAEWLAGPTTVAAYGMNGAQLQSYAATGRNTKRA